MNNKGFTMIEVLAAFLLLGILATFATVSVIDYLDAADKNALATLKENIKSGMINYYNECKYLSTGDAICKPGGSSAISGNTLSTTISDLVNYGFLENQGKKEEGSVIIKDPTTDDDITSCRVSITYYNDLYLEEIKRQTFSDVTYAGDCGSLSD